MSVLEEFSPTIVGEIDDGPFGKVPLYVASLASDIDKIYEWRQLNSLAESEDGTDEFFFLAPTEALGTKGDDVNYTLNNVSKKGSLFVSPKINYEPIAMFKAYYHLVGSFIEPVSVKDIGLNSTLDELYQAYFTLPKIPFEMVSKMDSFFREVENKFGTEGIVLLTYDFNFRDDENDAGGWGFAVPDQKNTGVHCDYDKTEVITNLDPNTRIVGTVHSHPGMRAYASSTDHNDQAGFDGLHITFGWSNTTHNETEYHSELVRGGNFTWIDPEDVMDLESQFMYQIQGSNGQVYEVPVEAVKKTRRKVSVDEAELTALTDKVEKAWATTTTYNKPPSGQQGTLGKAQPPARLGELSSIDLNKFLPSEHFSAEELFSSTVPLALQKYDFNDFKIPDPRYNNVLIRIKKDSEIDSCPICETVWANTINVIHGSIMSRRQCMGCGIFILFENESIQDMDNERKKYGFVELNDFLDFELPFIVWNFVDYDKVKKLTDYETIQVGDSKKV